MYQEVEALPGELEMGTKINPGEFDCYANAEADEPMFVLLARDITSKYFVRAWVAIQCGDIETAQILMVDAAREREQENKVIKKVTDKKMVEAEQCSVDMENWLCKKSKEIR